MVGYSHNCYPCGVLSGGPRALGGLLKLRVNGGITSKIKRFFLDSEV